MVLTSDELKELRAGAHELASRFALKPGSDASEVLRALEMHTGHHVFVTRERGAHRAHDQGGCTISGSTLVTANALIINIDPHRSAWGQYFVLNHEAFHLLDDHVGTPTTEISELARHLTRHVDPSLADDFVAVRHHRYSYASRDEQKAEVFANLMTTGLETSSDDDQVLANVLWSYRLR